MTTFRELVCQWNMEQHEDYDAWLDRLRRANRESERQREEARAEAERVYEQEKLAKFEESDYDRAMRHRVEVD